MKFNYLFVAIVFFVLGAAAFNYYQIYQLQAQKNTQIGSQIFTPTSSAKSPFDIWTPNEAGAEISPDRSDSLSFSDNSASPKYTIFEIEKISADKSFAQTGETVNFTATLKNTGSVKKFLTHICFNYSGGNFGCVRNINLGPGEVFNINNSMMFPDPGKFSVWITWSQDHTNFYRPSGGGTASVQVY